MGDAVRQRLDCPGAGADVAVADRSVLALRPVGHRTLRLHHLGKGSGGFLRGQHIVDVKKARAHLHQVTGQADQAFDQNLMADRMAEHHDIAAFGFGTPDAALDRAGVERAGIARIAVSHLVDEQEIPDQQGVLHRFRRNPVGLKEQGADGARDDQGPEHRPEGVQDAAKGRGLTGHVTAFSHGISHRVFPAIGRASITTKACAQGWSSVRVT